MRILRFLFAGLLVGSLASCGGSDEPNFAGTWDGSLPVIENDCPFSAAPSVGQLFPMNVSIDGAGVYTVTAANGDVAVGGQGEAETVSFIALSDKFGTFASTAPYSCTANPTPYTVGYLDNGDNAAIVNVYVVYTSCSVDGNNSTSSCSVRYSGEATKR